MRLISKAIINFQDINHFAYANQWTIRAGDQNSLYFQLADLDQNGLRYIPGIGSSSSITVKFPSLDDDLVVELNAIQDVNDGSIWHVNVPADTILASGNVFFTITDNSIVRKFNVMALLSVEQPFNAGSC